MLKRVDGIRIQEVPEGGRPEFWRYAFTLIDPAMIAGREKILARLRASGVGVSRWQDRPLPDHQVFVDGFGHGCPWSCHGRPAPAEADLPVARALADSMIWLEDAIAPTNGAEQLASTAEAVEDALRAAGQAPEA